MSATIDHLNAIRDEFGSLTPELVADVAAAEDHPLHALVYDCAPEEASRRYYVSRAAQVLRITYKPVAGSPNELRAFMAVRGENAPRADYVPTAEALADPFTRKLLLAQMKREWLTYKRRYDHLVEFADFIQSQIEGESA